jgi:ClpP class serine protease
MTDTSSRAWDLLLAESSIWLMSSEQMSAHAAQIAMRLSGDVRTDGSHAALDRRPASSAPSSTAVIPITGALTKRGSFFADVLGFSSYAGIRSALAQAVADTSVERILLLVDSGGGSAPGCLECASDIVGASRRKNVTAWIAEGGLCCSAAYCLVAGANQIIASPSSEIGSIGVWQLHLDVSRALEREGVVPTFIVARQSPRKVEPTPSNRCRRKPRVNCRMVSTRSPRSSSRR